MVEKATLGKWTLKKLHCCTRKEMGGEEECTPALLALLKLGNRSHFAFYKPEAIFKANSFVILTSYPL